MSMIIALKAREYAYRLVNASKETAARLDWQRIARKTREAAHELIRILINILLTLGISQILGLHG